MSALQQQLQESTYYRIGYGATFKNLDAHVRAWNASCHKSKRIKAGPHKLAETLLKIYAAFMNKRVLYGLAGEERYNPPFKVNNVQLAGKLHVTVRTIQNWRKLLTQSRILLGEYYCWHGSNSSYQVMLNHELIVTEPIKDRGKYFGFLYAVKKEEQPAVENAAQNGEEQGQPPSGFFEVAQNLPHTEAPFQGEIIQNIIQRDTESAELPPKQKAEGLPEEKSSEKQTVPSGNQSGLIFLKGAKGCKGNANVQSTDLKKNSAKNQIPRASDIVKNSARSFCEADLLREISKEIYGSIWLADSQITKLKENIRAIYACTDDPKYKLLDVHTQCQQRLSILKRWLSRGSCHRCGWKGKIEQAAHQADAHCPDCGTELRARYIPLPSSGYWDPAAATYFTRGFGITRKWWLTNRTKNLKAQLMSLVKREANKVIRNPTVEQYRQSAQRIGKHGNEWALTEFNLRVRDRNLLQEDLA